MEHLSKMLFVFFYNFKVNKNVTHKYQHDPIQMFMKQGVHQGHKNCCSVCELERHYNIL